MQRNTPAQVVRSGASGATHNDDLMKAPLTDYANKFPAAEIRDQRVLLTLALIGAGICSGQLASAMGVAVQRQAAVMAAKRKGWAWGKAQLMVLIHDSGSAQAPAGVIQRTS